MTSDDHVRAALAEWLDALNSRDLARFQTLFDDEIVYANAHGPLRLGRGDVMEAWRPLFDRPEPLLEFTEEAVVSTPAMGLISGRWQFVSDGDDGVRRPSTAGRVGLVFRRSDEGRWLLVFDMDNQPPDTQFPS